MSLPSEQALYVLSKEDSYRIMIVSTDKLLCFYHDHSTFNLLLFNMNKWFRIKSQEVPVLKCFNLHNFQSKNGIIFDQNLHIKQTIVGVWFPNPDDKIRVSERPLQKYSIYELYLADTLPIQTDDTLNVENTYRGLTSNDQICKYLHVEEWSRPDLF